MDVDFLAVFNCGILVNVNCFDSFKIYSFKCKTLGKI